MNVGIFAQFCIRQPVAFPYWQRRLLDFCSGGRLTVQNFQRQSRMLATEGHLDKRLADNESLYSTSVTADELRHLLDSFKHDRSRLTLPTKPIGPNVERDVGARSVEELLHLWKEVGGLAVGRLEQLVDHFVALTESQPQGKTKVSAKAVARFADVLDESLRSTGASQPAVAAIDRLARSGWLADDRSPIVDAVAFWFQDNVSSLSTARLSSLATALSSCNAEANHCLAGAFADATLSALGELDSKLLPGGVGLAADIFVAASSSSWWELVKEEAVVFLPLFLVRFSPEQIADIAVSSACSDVVNMCLRHEDGKWISRVTSPDRRFQLLESCGDHSLSVPGFLEEWFAADAEKLVKKIDPAQAPLIVLALAPLTTSGLSRSTLRILSAICKHFSMATLSGGDDHAFIILTGCMWPIICQNNRRLEEFCEFLSSVSISRLSPAFISICAMAATRCGVLKSPFYAAARDRCCDKINNWQPGRVSLLAWALAKTDNGSQRFYKELTEYSLARLNDFSWRQLGKLLYTFVLTGRVPPRLTAAATARYSTTPDTEITGTDMSFLISAIGLKANRTDSDRHLLEEIGEKLAVRLPSMDLGEQMFAVQALRQALILRGPLVISVLNSMIKHGTSLQPREIHHVCLTFSIINPAGASKFFELAVEQLTSKWSDFEYYWRVAILLAAAGVQKLPTEVLQHFMNSDHPPGFLEVSPYNTDYLWLLHLCAVARGLPGLPVQLRKRCHKEAVSVAKVLHDADRDADEVRNLAACMVDAFNDVRKSGLVAIDDHVETNLVLPSGQVVAAAMAFDEHWHVAFWSYASLHGAHLLGSNRHPLADVEKVNLNKANISLKKWRKSVRQSSIRLVGVVLLDDGITDKGHLISHTKLKKRIFEYFGWQIMFIHRKSWLSVMEKGEGSLILRLRLFEHVTYMQNVRQERRQNEIVGKFKHDRRKQGHARR